MIKLTDVTHSYDEKAVISNLSFTFPSKGVFALRGPSGKGLRTRRPQSGPG